MTTNPALLEMWQLSRPLLLVNTVRNAAKAYTGSVLFSLAQALAFIPFVIFTQFVPTIMRSVLDRVDPLLADLSDPRELHMVETLFLLYYHGLKDVYRPYCVRRAALDALIDDFDDYLDDFDMIRSGEMQRLVDDFENWRRALDGAA